MDVPFPIPRPFSYHPLHLSFFGERGSVDGYVGGCAVLFVFVLPLRNGWRLCWLLLSFCLPSSWHAFSFVRTEEIVSVYVRLFSVWDTQSSAFIELSMCIG